EQLDYWRDKLSALPVLDLPIDRPRRPTGRPVRPAEGSMELDAGIGASLRHLSQQEGVTPFIIMLSVFNVLLSRCCNQEDVAVGTVIAGRGRPETQDLIGFF